MGKPRRVEAIALAWKVRYRKLEENNESALNKVEADEFL